MKKRMVCLLILFAGIMASNASASPTSRFDETTQTCRKFQVYDAFMIEGNKLFFKNCKVCHYRENDKGAPFLYTESKMSEAWNRVFFERYPECAQDGSWDHIELQDLLKINDFLYRFGAGSFDPNNADDAFC